MSAMSELLDGAVREDAVRLASGSFATDRFGAVRGRIARRRAARSAGVGGASVLGIGVLAVGGSQLAGSNFDLAGPGTGASVVCTTAAPNVDGGVVAVVPDGARYAVADTSTGATFFIGWADGDSRVWNLDASEAPLSLLDGTPTFVLPSGITLALDREDGPPLASDTALVTVTPIETYAQQIGLGSLYDVELGAVPGSRSAWDLKLNGGSIGTFTSDGFTATFTFENGESETFDLAESGIVRLPLPGGENLVFRRADGQPVYVGEATAAAVATSGPNVTCSTGSPQPSASASASPSPSPSVTPSRTPDPAVSASLATATSPFACWYTLDAPVHESDGLSISSQKWISSADAQKGLLDEFGGQWPASIPRPTGEVLTAEATLTATMPNGTDPLLLQGSRDASDPVDGLARETELSTISFFAGLTVVGVANGQVVASVPETSLTNKWLYNDTIPRGNGPLGLSVLDASRALVPCGDGQTWDDLYIVAAVGAGTSDGWDMAPVYAWAKVVPQG